MKALYIHIPFCLRKCFYCSFVVSIGQEKRIDDYVECLIREMARYKKCRMSSVYIGGGTPTLMGVIQWQKLFRAIHEKFIIAPDAEWTVESNPEGLSDDLLRCLKANGVNRISLGVQTFNDNYLKYLGRCHNAKKAVEAFEQIRHSGFDNINVDLMMSFPQQTFEELKRDVASVIQLSSEHVSLYSLEIERNSKFYTQGICLQDGQAQAGQYEYACEALAAGGFRQYEVSNFAQPHRQSRHNKHYWQGGEYIGLGIGAHSHIGERRSWNCASLTQYITQIEHNLSVEAGYECRSKHIQMMELLLFGLRMNDGINVAAIESRFGCFLSAEQKNQIRGFVRDGYLNESKGNLRASMKGRLILDDICSRLI